MFPIVSNQHADLSSSWHYTDHCEHSIHTNTHIYD